MSSIGSEGTIPALSEKKELERKTREAQSGLAKSQADIHQLIHTLFHPTIKFAGKSKTLLQIASILHEAIPSATRISSTGKELSDQLMTALIQTRDKLRERQDIEPLIVKSLEEKFTKIINVFDYTLQSEKDRVLLDNKTMETATWILEELRGINYFKQNTLSFLITRDFIELLQGILLNYLEQNTEILVGETEMLNRQVESLRTFISLEKQRKYYFARHDVKDLLEDNIRVFKAMLAEKNIEVELKIKGNLLAEISKQDIDRVIANLFLNVRNYSYTGEGRFVKINARELQPQNQVGIAMENYGLPIKQEEIDSGDIFKFGYRGAFSYKADRDGIGAGLADAKQVIDAHGGEILVTSKPVGDDGDPAKYKAPYLTKVVIRIPKSQKKKENS